MADVLFKKVDYTLKKLIEDIRVGEIGLPDIQRPFVWPRVKIRDLFDSMYRVESKSAVSSIRSPIMR